MLQKFVQMIKLNIFHTFEAFISNYNFISLVQKSMLLWAILGSFIVFLFYVLETMVAISLISVVVGGIMSLVYFNQNKLLYMPAIPDMPLSPSQNPYPYRHPKQQGLNAIDLELKTQDGLMIRGWHVKKQNAHQVIVYFHQNAGSNLLFIIKDIGFRIPLIKQLTKRTNSDVILVAYRGYSDSDGLPSQQGLQKDAQTIINYAINYAESQQPKMDVFLYGRSLGGAVSIYLGSHTQYKSKIRGLILQNTFTSISDMIDAIMPIFKYLKFLQRNHWKSIQRIPQIQKPILFIRSLRDEIVPTSQMVRLYQNVDQGLYVQEHIIQMGTHNSSWDINKEEYFDRLNKFIAHPRVSSRIMKEVNQEIGEAYVEEVSEEEAGFL